MFYIIIVIITLLFLAYRHFKNRNEFFKKLGIPGPEPSLVFGNLKQIKDASMALRHYKWGKVYGKTFGYMEGATPILVTSDLDILQDVFVKKFPNFYARKVFPMQRNKDMEQEKNCLMSQGPRWKRQRTIANPTFSSSKLKQIFPVMNDSVDVLMNRLEHLADEGTMINIHKYFQELTIDVIGRIAFGEKHSTQGNENNRFLQLAKGVMKEIFVGKRAIVDIIVSFPEFHSIIRFVFRRFRNFKHRNDPTACHQLDAIMKELVDRRRQESVELKEGSEKKNDFIQLFLDAEAEPDEDILTDHHQTDMRTLKVTKKMTPDEVQSTCTVFLIAGYETTAHTLGFLASLLATNPRVQEKLAAEISEAFEDQESITPESIQRLQYLDAVTKESLRLYPIAASGQQRQCMSACTIGNLHIPEGTIVAANVLDIHKSKEIWGEDAAEFRPERFLEDNKQRHQLSWMPFGAGPRICLGMRLALLEEKLTVCKLIKRFKLVASQETAQDPEIENFGATFGPKSVMVKLEKQ